MISFIIVAKNESLRIADAINSIISTSIKNYEIIIIEWMVAVNHLYFASIFISLI